MNSLKSSAFKSVAQSACSKFDFVMEIPSDARRQLARGWLLLGLIALLLSGLLSVLLVLSRTPGAQNLLPVADFFRVALVVHVDLSVLVWFISIAGMIWSINSSASAVAIGTSALYLCGVGTGLMAAAPIIGRGEPLMANYIPVLNEPVFLSGLVVVGLGFAILVGRSLWFMPGMTSGMTASDALKCGINLSVVAAAVALAAFVASWFLTPDGLSGKPYFEILFWGGGHTLQFSWTLMMLVAWLWLAHGIGAKVSLSPRFTVLMYLLTFSGSIVTPVAYFLYDVASVEHRDMLTWAMRVGGGIAIAPMGIAVVKAVRSVSGISKTQRPLFAALASSVMLFCVGGLIGMFISGNNVKIPAHYHGSIVGVTLALMGMVYYLLPRLGFGTPDDRMAAVQPYVYGFGQLMHIIGLVWSGGYGVQRKVAGAEQVLRSTGEIAGMGLMGLGGLIAIIGGLLFVVAVIRAIRCQSQDVSASV